MKAPVNCRLCREVLLEEVFDFGQLPVPGYLEDSPEKAVRAPRFQLGLGICRNCGLLQQAFDDANEFLHGVVYRKYQPTYSASTVVANYVSGFAKRAIAASSAAPGNTVVEIGCNDGRLLAVFRSMGLEPVGIEPSRSFTEHLAVQGIDVLADYFSSDMVARYLERYRKPRLAVARHTLEHALDPVDFLKGMKAILDPQGVAVIEVPYLPTQIANNHYSSMTFQHISFFTVRSISQALEMAGLAPLSIEFVETDGGSMVVYAGHKRRVPESTTVAHARLLEESLSYHVASGFDDFFRRVDRERVIVKNLLGDYRTRGEVVAAYGAGGKGQGLINILGCDTSELPFAIDSTVGDTPKYIPGTRIPVFSVDSSQATEVTMFFVSAPTHAREIVQKERARRSLPVQFLLISPQLHLA